MGSGDLTTLRLHYTCGNHCGLKSFALNTVWCDRFGGLKHIIASEQYM